MLIEPQRRAAPSAALLRLWQLALFGLLAVAALVPRAWDLGGFITIDEANFWLRRSEIFLAALHSGDYAATALSAHPGVTTMWLGSAGILLRRALLNWGLLHDLGFPVRLALLRLPLILVHCLVLLASYALLRRLLPARVALLAGLLWALDPFVIGYSRLLHTDALLASFATLSLLAALVALRGEGQWRWLAVSGVFAGLALLSKLPALALIPAVGLAALLRAQDAAPFWPGVRRMLLPLALWALLLAITVVALWPALWVDPGAAWHALREGAEVEGGQPHMMGNFFMGQEVAAPGPLFYPVALALRLTPAALLGLLALGLPAVWRRLPTTSRRDLALLAAFVLIMVLALSLFPKKFNRYLVPAFPALDVLAAAGLLGLTDWLLQTRQRWREAGQLATTVIVALLGAMTLARVQPYAIAYFNPLLGGTAAGARTFVVGWGEGYEQVAAWLNEQPDIGGVLTVSNMTPTLQPYLRQGAQAVAPRTNALPAQAGYVVVYIEQVQRGLVLPPFDQFYGRATPLHTVRVAGLEYAWIYQVPPPLPQALAADFGSSIHLRGLEHGQLRAAQPLRLRLFWEARGQPAADYMLFVHLIGPDGQRVAQADLAPGGEQAATSSWRAGRFVTSSLDLPLPKTLPHGEYRLLLGMYDPATGQRLPLTAGQPADPALDGPQALLLATLQLAR